MILRLLCRTWSTDDTLINIKSTEKRSDKKLKLAKNVGCDGGIIAGSPMPVRRCIGHDGFTR